MNSLLEMVRFYQAAKKYAFFLVSVCKLARKYNFKICENDGKCNSEPLNPVKPRCICPLNFGGKRCEKLCPSFFTGSNCTDPEGM